MPFLEDLSGRDIEYQGNRHLSAVLFVERAERTYALTFGFGRHLLDPEAIEADFGLRTAAALINPDAIASIDSRAFEATILQVRRQSSRGTGTRAIGFDTGREMLRAIAGEVLDESLGARVTGSDSLGLTASLDVVELGPRLDRLGEAYASKGYKKSFGYLDRWQRLRATDPVHGELDDALLARLARRWQDLHDAADPAHLSADADGPVLTVPQIIEYNSSGFLTSPEARTGTPHPFPNLDAYLSALDHPPTLRDLRQNHDLILMAGEPFAVDGRWRIYNGLTAEVPLAGTCLSG